MPDYKYTLQILSLSGTSATVGQALGKIIVKKYGYHFLKKRTEELQKSSLLSALGFDFTTDPKIVELQYNYIVQVLEKVYPDLLEEISGIAKVTKQDFKRLVVYLTGVTGRGCSHFSYDGILAHNYEDLIQGVDGIFLETDIQGVYKNFGASDAYIGRLDGMNEHGIAVSLSYGAGEKPVKMGISATLFLRIILDKAKTLDDIVRYFEIIPFVTPNIVMATDKNGRILTIEVSGKHHQMSESHTFTFRANRYIFESMKPYQKRKNPTTKWREEQIAKFGSTEKSLKDIQAFLISDFPKGIFEPYYSWGLGTLWSVVYDAKNLKIYLAEGGSRTANEFKEFSLRASRIEKNTLIHLLHNVPISTRLKKYLRIK